MRNLLPLIAAFILFFTAPVLASTESDRKLIHGILAAMTEQLVAVSEAQTMIFGTFFDAAEQLDTQRLYQELHAKSHKDYQPSEGMCAIGTGAKSLAASEELGAFNKEGFNQALMDRMLLKQDTAAARGSEIDVWARLKQFKEAYCDPRDNNNGLNGLCGAGVAKKERINRDIDYTRTVEKTLTYDMDFSRADVQEDREDILAMAKNLYWPEVFISEADTPKFRDKYPSYFDKRKVVAMTNVAQNSFLNIAALKTAAPQGSDNGKYLHAAIKNFGFSDDQAKNLLGERPSHYAQMEILTKKMYQDPDFYTNLYDKPANVQRFDASMEGIKLMQEREQYKSALRKEMLLSMLVEQALSKHYAGLDSKVRGIGQGVR